MVPQRGCGEGQRAGDGLSPGACRSPGLGTRADGALSSCHGGRRWAREWPGGRQRRGGLGILVRKMGDYVIPTSQAAVWKVLVCSVSPGPGTKETAPEPGCGPLLPPPLTSVTNPKHGKRHPVPGPCLTEAVLLGTPGEGLAGHGQGEQSGSQLGPEPLFFDDQTPTRGPLRGGRGLQVALKSSHHHFSKTKSG